MPAHQVEQDQGCSCKLNRYAFKTYLGTANDKGKMLHQAITSILAPTENKDQHKFGRAWMSSGLTNKIHLRLQNKERSIRDLSHRPRTDCIQATRSEEQGQPFYTKI
jgi:hypothetical protein